MKKIKKSYIRLEYINCTNDADIIESHGNRMVLVYSSERDLYWSGVNEYTRDKAKARSFSLRHAHGITRTREPGEGIEFHFVEDERRD